MSFVYEENQPLLIARDVRKGFGHTSVLRGVDFTVKKGERIALMGPSGAGKSTLLNCLGGIEKPDTGEIFLAGQDITKFSADELAYLRRLKIGTVFQFFHLLPTLTVRENIGFPMELAGWTRRRREERTKSLMEEVQITHRASAYPDTLSGGEQQRVAIARALAVEPPLLLADEPTGNLDRKTGDSVLQLIQSLSDEHDVAMVMVTHDERSTRICHRILRIDDGVVSESTPDSMAEEGAQE